MYFLVILAFLGSITGETFFHHQENGNVTLLCNKSVTNGKNGTVWYETDELLQQFSQKSCTTKCRGTNQQCGNASFSNQLPVPASKGGGVFACEPFTTAGSQTCPFFTNVTHCRHYDFFIVAIINLTADSEMFEKTEEESHDNHSVQEESNITLSCKFQMKTKEQSFIIYWIKYTETSKCLLSANCKFLLNSNCSHNEHCCIDEMIKGRLVTNASLDLNETRIVLNMTIFNVMFSDSGTYLCVVNTWSRGKHVWKIANNFSIQVTNLTTSPSASVAWYATTGMITGIIIISGIAWLIYKKKIKSKGRPSAQLSRAQDAIEIPGDECSPYAICSNKDMQIYDMYSLATRPHEDPNVAYSMVATAADKGPGNEIHTVYEVV